MSENSCGKQKPINYSEWQINKKGFFPIFKKKSFICKQWLHFFPQQSNSRISSVWSWRIKSDTLVWLLWEWAKQWACTAKKSWIQTNANSTCREIFHCAFENLTNKIKGKKEKEKNSLSHFFFKMGREVFSFNQWPEDVSSTLTH